VTRATTPTDEASALTPAAVADVEVHIRPYVRRTPVIEIDRADFGLPAGPLTLKLEQFQHSGAFKVRGAFANLLLRDVPAAGVTAASGGNHGAAVAYAAGVLGVPARIFVPEVSPAAKVSRIRSYGADLVIEGATYSDAFAVSQRWVAASGAMPVHAFNQAETVLAAIGGGGLLSGIATAYGAGKNGAVRVVGVEPEGAPTMTAALAAGRPVDAATGSVAVDSLAPRQVGELTFRVVSQRVHAVVLVSDEAIGQAQRTLWEKLRVVGEPGGCAALAALLSGRYVPEPGESVAVVISGANTSAVSFDR